MPLVGVLALAAAFVQFAPSATATPAPATPATPAATPAPIEDPLARYSPYERDSIVQVLAARGAGIDPHPDGKLVEGVDVVRLEVIEQRDPAPFVLNLLHATTRRHVVEREVLLHTGERYDQITVDESARNLREHFQLSLVLLLATQGSGPDKVRILAITKDVWSLRLNSDFRVVAGRLDYLILEPSEENLAGLHHTAAVYFLLQPLSYAIGPEYQVFRLFGSRVAASANLDAVINRPSGAREGSFGSLHLGQPLYSSRTEWAWSVGASFRDDISRHYVNGLLGGYAPMAMPTMLIPYEYRRTVYAAAASLTRSFGVVNKQDVSVGLDTARERYWSLDLSAYDPVAAQQFRDNAIPQSDTRVGPFVGYRAYTSRFLKTLDFETLGLQEDFRLGHDLRVAFEPVLAALGSRRSYLRSSAAAQYTLVLGSDGLARASLGGSLDASSAAVGVGPTSKVWDAEVDAHVRVMSPRTSFGRFLVDGTLLAQPRNYLNQINFLGGDGQLRGFPSQLFYGKDLVALTAEYRSRAVHLRSIEVGGALFVDSGDAFDGGTTVRSFFDDITWYHSAGVGARVLFPQLQRYVLRADLGFPIGPRPAGVTPVQGVITFQQAFPVPAI